MKQPDLFEQVAQIARLRFHDITARKHGGVETSVAANLRVDKTAGRMMVLDYLEKHGTGTLKEIADHYGKEKNEISGRFTELLAIGMILVSGDKRDGFRVYILNDK